VGGETSASLIVPAGEQALTSAQVAADLSQGGLRRERQDYLRGLAERLREQAGVEATVVVLDGRADDAIRDRAREKAADLVVMATHGRGPMERAWLGSVADRLVRELSIPTLLVRPAEEAGRDLGAPPPARRVVVTLDGSPLAEVVLGPATDLAAALNVPVAFIRAIGGQLDFGSTYLPHAAQAYHQQVEAERAEAEAYLQAMTTRAGDAGVRIEGYEVVHGPAARTILGATEGEAGDILAMATHGRGGLRRLILGSVSDKVVRAADGPVLLVRPKDVP
jgi:nucleotide-binding universal stress UspA family protein